MDKLWYLSRINVMSELSQDELAELGRMAPMNVTRKGTIISSPNYAPPTLYLLKKGKVRLYKITREGKELTLGILGEGNIFGEIETFSAGTRNVYVEAIEDTMLCLLNKVDFERFMKERPELALKMIQVLTERLREAEEMLENMMFGSMRKRLLYLLWKLSHTFGSEDGEWIRINVGLSHQDLANMMGTFRETVSLHLAQLVKEGIVVKSPFRKTIKIAPEKVREALEAQEG